MEELGGKKGGPFAFREVLKLIGLGLESASQTWKVKGIKELRCFELCSLARCGTGFEDRHAVVDHL